MKVNLEDLLEAMEFENEDLEHYYNKKTGIIMYKENEEVSGYSASDNSKLEDFEEWERFIIESLHDLKTNPNDYIKLPVINDSIEQDLMFEFARSIDYLGDGDFVELKRYIQDKGKFSEWFDFKEDKEKELLIKWCEKNNIECM